MRLLRATKNRFGSTDELGVFEMREAGLREVADPGRAFLAEHGGAAPGGRESGGRESVGEDGLRVVAVANLRDALRAALMAGERRSEDLLEGTAELAPVTVDADTRVVG